MNKLIVFLLLLCVSTAAKPIGKDRLFAFRAGIERIILNADPYANVGVEVVSLKTGEVLFQKNCHHLLVPASNLKLLTGAAALYLLGVDYRFETALYTDGKIENGMLKGDLFLKGSGDPELAVRDLEELAFQLKLLGIESILGNLYVDITLFDEISQGPGWMWDDQGEKWNSPLSALMLNHSCIDLWVKPHESAGKAPYVYVFPRNDFVEIDNHALTASNDDTLAVERRWQKKENVIDIKGKISQVKHYSVPIEYPHLYAASVFSTLLNKAGIDFDGKIEMRPVSDNALPLAAHASRPLSLIVKEMMKSSDNLIADSLFKKIGEARYGRPGSWQKGSKAIRDFLSTNAGVDTQNMVVMDGSGLSRYNLVSAHHFTDFLKWMHKEFSCGSEFAASLPISGIDGTLDKRMAGLKGKIRAKTGGMTGISSLCGYAMTKEGELLAFSILENGFTKPVDEYRTQIEDAICAFLTEFSWTK